MSTSTPPIPEKSDLTEKVSEMQQILASFPEKVPGLFPDDFQNLVQLKDGEVTLNTELPVLTAKSVSEVISKKVQETQERRDLDNREIFDAFREHFRGKIWNRHDQFFDHFKEFFEQYFEGIRIFFYPIHKDFEGKDYMMLGGKKVYCDQEATGERNYKNEREACRGNHFSHLPSEEGGAGAIKIDFPWENEKIVISFGDKNTSKDHLERIKTLLNRDVIHTIIESELKAFSVAYIDPKTKLANGTYAKSRYAFTPSSVIYIDIDNFKQINDTLGHDKGDDCIVKIAEILRDFCKKSSSAYVITPAHLHGDEFILLLETHDVKEVEAVTKLLHKEVSNHIFFEQLNQYFCAHPVGVSTGYALYEEKTTFREALKKADTSMYRCKKDKKKSIGSQSLPGNDPTQESPVG